MNRRTYAFALLALLAAVIAGCGSSGSSNTTSESEGGAKENASSESSAGAGENKSASSESSGSSGGKAAVISLGHTKVGMVLVDSDGMTLYDFHKDKGTTSSCYGPCAEGWPPALTEGKPTAGNGASASKLSVTKRKDGRTQIVYAGHPLYTFVEDKKPGEANGNDVKAFGASWYALKGNGEEAGD